MATYDNKHWLLTNIRNSFISTDDTGMCEIVMTGENFPKLFYNKAMEEKNRIKDTTPMKCNDTSLTEIQEDEPQKEIVTEYDPYPEMEDSDEEVNGSYIRYEDFGPRQRSNTALWLDKKEQALKKAAKIEVIKWHTPTTQLSEKERAELFPKKEIAPVKEKEQKKSLLADQLEKCPHLPHRQYLDYAKFDGTAQLGLPTRTFKIFMTMLPEKYQNYPISVSVIASATIQDLIGFVCYKYSIDHPDIVLGSVRNYGLCLVEDDGEVDWDFPCLDSKEPCSKFGFPCLGLIELGKRQDQPSAPISMPEDSGLSSAFQMIFPKPTDSGHSQHYGSRHNTGGSGTSEAVLHAIQAVNDDRKGAHRASDLDKIQSHIMATEAPQYKTYRVQLLHKMRANTPVQLGISLDKIEVEPLVSGGNKFWPRTKYFLHTIDTIAWCELLEPKGSKTTFRIVYSRSGHNTSLSERQNADNTGMFLPSSAYKHHDFESSHETARHIVEKINRILELRNSPCRREYKTAKEKKQQTRRSLAHQKNISCS